MRVQTEEWRRFIPGIRMYKGKKTLFYNGEKLVHMEGREGDMLGCPRYFNYDQDERQSWEVIIVLPGVEVIPEFTFFYCENVKTVIMADTVKRIEDYAYWCCKRLVRAKLSTNLEYIGYAAFGVCLSLTSIFIPPSCTEIGGGAFKTCTRLMILHVPQQTQIGEIMIEDTALIRASPFEVNQYGSYNANISENVNEWIKNINGNGDQFALHRACSSDNPITNNLHEIVQAQGLSAFKKENQIGVTPVQYLEANPFAEDIDQRSFLRWYVMQKMGEVV
ncbi:leucine-rich repeat domain-containing protein [Chaetoceros tenuissimus]|uniref:Leucine-rich repeat domain-containing protein n=1 Tax=Chaetoceros tenuissimus TaxID=426638 RepID=A0AAD3D5J0_9STRA|nr:leucine-rich repeat domain-containing protein [Chaetoceros tenuissimus]